MKIVYWQWDMIHQHVGWFIDQILNHKSVIKYDKIGTLPQCQCICWLGEHI